MSRIKILDRSEMTEEQARVYDSAVASGSPLGGPYYAYIRLPSLFEGAQGLREAFAGTPLSRREQQVVNLVVARHFSARYPWFAQVRASLQAGIPEAAIKAINAGETPDLPDAAEAMCYAAAREMLDRKTLSDETYAQALKVLGQDRLIAMTAATGSFAMTCLTANVFDIPAPADDPMPLAS